MVDKRFPLHKFFLILNAQINKSTTVKSVLNFEFSHFKLLRAVVKGAHISVQ